MAALQKIRNKGGLLMIVIGLALFAFIAEEFFRSIETTSNESKQQVGEVYGEKLSVQEFQEMVDEAAMVIKMQRGTDNLNEDEMNQLRDQVWNDFVFYKLVEHEADKIGMTVTDEEMQNALREGTNQLLLQTPFINQATRRFDVSMLQEFKKSYKEMQSKAGQVPQEYLEQYAQINQLWNYVEKSLRKQLLMEKFQNLLAMSVISNPIAAKMAFKAQTEQSNIEVTSIAYNSISDKDVQVTDADLKAEYEKQKERFFLPFATRDIRYIDVAVQASKDDQANLAKEMDATYNKLTAADADVAAITNASKSVIKYVNLPLSKNAFPADIQGKIDSMAAGTTTRPYTNKGDNTMNIIKLMSKVQAPDSIQFRAVSVAGQTKEEIAQRADSIMKALQGGADFEAVAKKYGQTGEKTWLTSQQYEGSTLNEDAAKYLSALNTLGVNGMQNVELSQGNLILQVVDRKAMTTKYNVAVVKCPIAFSNKTYQSELNKLNVFMSKYKTPEAIAKNAVRNGYAIQERTDLRNSEHYVAGVANTKDAMKWIFDEAEEGEVSKLYECGYNNDHLLLVIVDKKHEKGYRPWDDKIVKETLRQMVINDKKAELIMSRTKNVKNMAQAKAQKGAVAQTLNDVVFTRPPFINATGVAEPAIGGRAMATKAGAFSGPIKGNGGVYFLQVLKKTQASAKYNQQQMEEMVSQMTLRVMGNQFFNDMYKNGKVVDNRYKF